MFWKVYVFFWRSVCISLENYMYFFGWVFAFVWQNIWICFEKYLYLFGEVLVFVWQNICICFEKCSAGRPAGARSTNGILSLALFWTFKLDYQLSESPEVFQNFQPHKMPMSAIKVICKMSQKIIFSDDLLVKPNQTYLKLETHKK